jgi:hypothetical protein
VPHIVRGPGFARHPQQAQAVTEQIGQTPQAVVHQCLQTLVVQMPQGFDCEIFGLIAPFLDMRQAPGPKTAAEMRTASLNETTHGLSVATDPDSLDSTAERVAAFIALGSIAQATARDSAAKRLTTSGVWSTSGPGFYKSRHRP